MNNPYIYLSTFTFILALYFIFTNYKKKKALKENEEREKEELRKILFDYFKERLFEIRSNEKEFNDLLKYDSGYFCNYQKKCWITKNTALYNQIKNKPYESILLDIEDVIVIKKFLNYFSNAESLRTKFNIDFIKNELNNYSNFFLNIEKFGLDLQQQTSIVTNEDNNIVIAGAGSGKTTTIVGKINYIINRYKVNPNEILLISFTRISADTLAKRINIKGVDAKTFHRFGLDVISSVEDKQPSIYDEAQFKSFVKKTFSDLLRNENYLQKVTSFFSDYLKEYKPQEIFENQGEYFQYLKDQNFKTYQQIKININGKETLKKEVVKSIEECKIANFLFFNGIEYEYELPYEFDTATQAFKQYKPDFTINPKSNNKLYLEHFALNKNGSVPEWFANKENGETWHDATKKYNDGIIWKRNEHKSHSTKLIETFSYEMHDGTLFDKLTKKLLENNIVFTPKSPFEIWKIISESAKEEVDNIIVLFQTFITLMKSNNYSIDDLIKKNEKLKDDFHKVRNTLFIEILKPIFESYTNQLTLRKEIDFSDMINKAKSYISAGVYNRKISYIIIDEFQDISVGRYELIKAIKVNNPGCKLFAVGDDWQSIYRFSGSDIALFKNFENYFGFTIKSKIETTYRFQNPLIELSSKFILKNPNQSTKELKGIISKKSTNYKIIYSESNNQTDNFALKEIFNQLIKNNNLQPQKKIYILGRYSFDIERIQNEDGITLNINEYDNDEKLLSTRIYSKDCWKYLKKNEKIIVNFHFKDEKSHLILQAEYLTVHKAKGLEAEIVIVINCNSGKHGFPSEMSDDTVLNLLLSEADQFDNGEERRLFYVAMTRAKEYVYFIAETSYKSKFIKELEVGTDDITIKKCPRCVTADLKLKKGITNGKEWGFYSCSNYIYGCNYQEWIR